MLKLRFNISLTGSSLPADEVGHLFAAVRRPKARGVGTLYVSHRLDEAFRAADRVAAMRDGLDVGGGERRTRARRNS